MNWLKLFILQKSYFRFYFLQRLLSKNCFISLCTVKSLSSSVSFYRLSLSILMSIVLSSSPLMAKKTQQPKLEKLSDYLLTSKQLRALKPKEQVRYISFLYHFIAAIEMLENSPKSPEYAQHFSPSSINSYVYLSRFFTPEAHAQDQSASLWGAPQGSLIPIASGLSNSGIDFQKDGMEVDLSSQLPCSDSFNPPNMNTVGSNGLSLTTRPCPKPKLTNANANAQNTKKDASEEIGSGSKSKENIITNNMEFNRFKPQKPQPSKNEVAKPEEPCTPYGYLPNNHTVQPDGKGGEVFKSSGPPCPPEKISGDGKGKKGAGEIHKKTDQPSDPSMVPQQATSQQTSSQSSLHENLSGKDASMINYRKQGNTCIFGLWPSEFRNMADRSVKCTRPPGSNCGNVEDQPGFRCNTFGFSRNKKSLDVSQSLCIPLNPLEDLTVRCVEKNKDLIERSVAMDPQQYDSFIKKLKEDLDHFENDFQGEAKDPKGKITFRQYCDKQQKSNIDLQRPECDALLGLIKILNEKVDIHEKGLAASASVAPSDPPADPTAAEKKPADGTK